MSIFRRPAAIRISGGRDNHVINCKTIWDGPGVEVDDSPGSTVRDHTHMSPETAEVLAIIERYPHEKDPNVLAGRRPFRDLAQKHGWNSAQLVATIGAALAGVYF